MENINYKGHDQSVSETDLYKNLLHSLDLGSWLSVQQLRIIETNMQVLNLKTEEQLFQIGSDDGYTYFLVSGHLELTAADGKRHVLAENSASSYPPVANLRKRRYTVKAMTPAKLIRIADSDLVSKLKKSAVDEDSGFEVEHIDDDSDFWDLLPEEQIKKMESNEQHLAEVETNATSYLNFTYS